MKKHSIFIITLLLLAGLAGCAGQEPDKTETEYSSAVSSTAETASASESIDSSPAGTVSSSAETTLPEPVPSEPQKEKTEEPVLPETSNPEKPTAPVQEISAPSKSTSAQTQKPAGTAPVPSAPPETETPKPTSPPAVSETPYVQPSADAVEKAVAEYVNEYRLAQGDTAAMVLPGLTNVARYRANQLITNFSHDEDTDACTTLKYGEFVDMTELGLPESSSYYQGYNREAIAKGNWTGTADEIAEKIAVGFQNSACHWSYVGSSEYAYMAVGITFNPKNSTWYCCICMSSKNYGD